MSWDIYLGLISFFTLVFTVFYSIAYYTLVGIWDTHRYYHQKKEAFKIISIDREPKKNLPMYWCIGISIWTSWIVVHFIILS